MLTFLYLQGHNEVEAISKIEKWFEVKPPAPLPARRAYAPEGTAQDRNRRNICKYFEDYDSSRKQRSGHLAFLRWLLVGPQPNPPQRKEYHHDS
jgi:hypothetical protein